jgi:hypothetical protein
MWLKMRWDFGFTEFYSNVYYKEDIAALINLIDYAKDDEIVKKSEIILDLLLYDVATQSINNCFTSVSGRAYEHNRKGGQQNNLDGATDYFFGEGGKIEPGMTYGLMTTKKYHLPPVLREIAKDSNSLVIKQCNGLDVSELKKKGFEGTGDKSMMMQLGMESFTNEEIVRNTLSFVRKNSMFSNIALKDFAFLNLTLFRILHLEPLVIKIVNPPTNGIAIQQGNTYTFKTNDYTLYTVQNYHPGTYADQQHVSGMNICNSVSIFHTHPARNKSVKQQSPNYWVGYGRLPHSAQDSSVSLSIYNIPNRKNIMEKELLDFTHAYFPRDKFDSIYLVNNYAFGKKGNTYCALICRNQLNYEDQDCYDLIQKGRKVFWITEAGSKDKDHSFSEFYKRILKNKLVFDPKGLELVYYSHEKEFQLKYGAGFYINGESINTNYDRFDSPYCRAKEAPEFLNIEYAGQSLYLNFNGRIRKF